MGGFGSGRRAGGGRNTVDGCRSVDVNYLNREGCLRPGRVATLQWSRSSECVGSIKVRAEVARIVLSYRHQRNGGKWTNVDEPVTLVRVPCPFGGSRPYFRCPGIVNNASCGRRVAKLYAAGRLFLCRHCYKLSYTSRNEGTWDRALRRVARLRVALGGDPAIASPFPERPQGMWQSRYDRLRARLVEAEYAANRAMVAAAARLLPSFGTCGQSEDSSL